MRKPVVACLLTVLLGFMFGAPPALSKGKAIVVADNYFVHRGAARTVTVERSDTVVWQWRGSNRHNVTVRRGPVRFHSRTRNSGNYRKKLTKRGTYKIICTLHAPRMRMTLKVE
jgi:plastocyanin